MLQQFSEISKLPTTDVMVYKESVADYIMLACGHRVHALLGSTNTNNMEQGLSM
jgi:hypothetical protein